MGAYTWTYIRIDKLNKKQIESCINHAKWLTEGNVYEEYFKINWEKALEKWLNSHKKLYDYYVNECGVPKEKMTDEYLAKDLKRKMRLHKLKLKCYDKCLNGEMTVEEMLRKTHQFKFGDFIILKRNNTYYIDINYEIFRNYEYCETEFTTVDELIEHCRNCKGSQFMDYDNTDGKYHMWNQEIEDRVRKYYADIGDNNFIVQFG
jgi:hypothetical protein